MENAAKFLFILYILAAVYVCLRADGSKAGKHDAEGGQDGAAPREEDGEQGAVRCGPLKSVLMPLLIAFFLTALASPLRFEILGTSAGGPYFPSSRAWLFVVLGLACGCAGDTFLEIGEKGKFLILGLGAFMLGHCGYIEAAASQIAWTQLGAPILISLVLYAVLLIVELRLVLPDVPKDMKGGVIAYMLVILVMSAVMYLRAGSVPAPAFVCGLAGSLLFILSDTILALHVFAGKSSRGVMETYTAAQALLTVGFLLAM